MKKALLAAAAIVALPVAAQAQAPQPGIYIGAEGGINWLTNFTANTNIPAWPTVSVTPQLGWMAGGVIGYDKAVNKATRVGWLVSGGLTHYSADSMDGDSKDWQLGAYIEHKNAGWDYSGLLSYGRNNYDLNRYAGGEKYNADYHANVWDIEARAKYSLPSTTERTWKVAPYGKLGYIHTSQESYDETGTGISAQHIADSSHSSVTGEVGVELGRQLGPDGGYRLALGYKRVLSGANPTLNGTFVGDTHPFTVQSENDRNFLTYSVAMHGKLGPQWSGQAEIRGEASPNTHKEIVSVTAQYSF